MQNIITLGADPTGVAFSDVAIAAAIAAGQGVYMPSGKYRVASGFALTTPQTVLGDGATTILMPDNTMPEDFLGWHRHPAA